jgi:hypothetical protein
MVDVEVEDCNTLNPTMTIDVTRVGGSDGDVVEQAEAV